MKNLFLPILFSLILWGCSTTKDTTNMLPEERLDYAKSLFNNEDYDEALKEFQVIVLQYPGNAVVDDGQFYLAQTRFKRKEYILAAYEFSKLIKNMPASEFVPQAQYQLASCYYLLSPNYALDQKYTKKAIEEYQAFIDYFPTDDKVPDAEVRIQEMNEKLAHKVYNTAYIYEKLEYYTAAIMYYDFVLESYHDTHYAPLASYGKINLLIDRDREDDALAEINRFIKKFPENERIAEVKKMQAKLENKLSAAK